MKKRFLSLLMAFCLMLSLVPVALAADGEEHVSTESALTSALSKSSVSTIYLDADITLSSQVTIGRTVTIDGGTDKHSLTRTGGDTDYAIMINAGVTGVTLKNLTITAPNGVAVSATGATIDSCDINAYRRGINFYIAEANSGATLNVTNCNIVNSRANDSYGVYYDIDNRGIATGNITGGIVTITGGAIEGFKYAINPGIDVTDESDLRDGNGTVFNITGLEVWGWTALNIWSANTTYNFTNCTLTGVNKFSSDINNFATIVFNDDANGFDEISAPTVNIYGGTLNAVQYNAAMQAAIYLDRDCYSHLTFSTYQNGTTTEKVTMQLFGSSEQYLPSAFAVNYRADIEARDKLINDSGFYNRDIVSVTSYILINEDSAMSANSEASGYADCMVDFNTPIEQQAVGGDLA